MSPKREAMAPPTGSHSGNDAGGDGRIGRLILNSPYAEPTRYRQYDHDADCGLESLRVLPLLEESLLPEKSQATGESGV